MQFSEMIQEVKNIIQDDTFDDSVAGYINEAFLQASGRINIPDLKRVGIATTISDQMFTSLAGISDGFSGRLSKVLSTTIQRFNSVEDLMSHILTSQRELTEVGSVEYVALEGKTLWYFPSPSTEEEIPCILFTNPTILEEDEDTPDFIPEICHRNIGVHGAAFLAYTQIEDGIDGEKVNSAYHYSLFEKGINSLQEWVGKNRINTICQAFNDDTVSTTQWGSVFERWSNAR